MGPDQRVLVLALPAFALESYPRPVPSFSIRLGADPIGELLDLSQLHSGAILPHALDDRVEVQAIGAPGAEDCSNVTIEDRMQSAWYPLFVKPSAARSRGRDLN